MTKNYSLLLMTGAFLIASCTKSPAPPESVDTVAKAESAAAAAAKAAHVIKPGKYRVCQEDADESQHDDVVGPHLVVDQTVEIRPLGANGATKVCLKKECPAAGSNPPESEVKVIWLGGDENTLGGESDFEHKKQNGQTVRRTHFVQIFNNPIDQGDAAFCKQDRDILTINFCTLDAGTGELNCVGTEPHLGHVHVEP